MYRNRLLAARFLFPAGPCRDAGLFASHFRGGDGAEQLPIVHPETADREDQPPRRRKRPSKSRLPSAQTNGSSEGLCSNCENRLDCMNRLQEGGVWHCEEYR